MLYLETAGDCNSVMETDAIKFDGEPIYLAEWPLARDDTHYQFRTIVG